METKKVDYNKVAKNYNERYKSNSMSGVEKFLANLFELYHPKNILEVGCGPGRWLTSLSKFNCELFGCDLSYEMIYQISNPDKRINLICGDANYLPFKESKFDFIYCVNAIHHFLNKKEFVQNAFNLLNPNGVLAIFGLDPREPGYKWYVYNFFDSTLENDLKRFPSFSEIETMLREAGFVNVQSEIAERIIVDRIGEDVFQDSFLRKDQSSQLLLLSDEDYSRGINKIKKAIQSDPQSLFPVYLTMKIITGKVN